MKHSKTLMVQGAEIALYQHEEQRLISLTDMAKKFGSVSLIEQWLRNKNTIEFLGVWESIYNPLFNSLEFEGIKNQAGFNRFSLSIVQWVKKTNARGLIAKTGRYGGTYAHEDIALEFGAWLDPVFKLYIIKEFKRLKEVEAERLAQQWDLKRSIAKLNYRIHTDAIKRNRINQTMPNKQQQIIYATEADMLNEIVFGCTALQWKKENPTLEGNMRDHADHLQLLVLSNLESLNSLLIDEQQSLEARFFKLKSTAEKQLASLMPSVKKQLKPNDFL